MELEVHRWSIGVRATLCCRRQVILQLGFQIRSTAFQSLGQFFQAICKRIEAVLAKDEQLFHIVHRTLQIVLDERGAVLES
eukprot:Skav224301  [mRNA]  locus=scaffold772:144450:151932:- [translate_table: standard]